ncbi:hypothetical protein CGRA01v4_00812 [Colletotrichum graminicola]|nr:hypothetical protein CGRA01v4_00812 [Colletotrichum graminicola]
MTACTRMRHIASRSYPFSRRCWLLARTEHDAPSFSLSLSLSYGREEGLGDSSGRPWLRHTRPHRNHHNHHNHHHHHHHHHHSHMALCRDRKVKQQHPTSGRADQTATHTLVYATLWHAVIAYPPH